MNSKNIVLILSLLMALLFLLGSVSASQNVDNSIDAVSDNNAVNEEVIGINSVDESVSTDDNEQIGGADDSNDDLIKAKDSEEIKSGDNGNGESLKSHNASQSNQIGYSVQDNLAASNFDVKFPKNAYFIKDDQDEYPDSFKIVISISKKAKGTIVVYKNNKAYEKIKLDPNVELKSKGWDMWTDEYRYIATDNGDSYSIKMRIYNFDVGKNNIVVKFNDGKRIVEKSAVVYGRFSMHGEKNLAYGCKIIYIRSTSTYHAYDGDKLSAEVDGKKYSVKTDGASFYIKLSSPLAIGEHTLKVTYLGTQYPSHSVQSQFNVIGMIDNIDYTKSYDGFKSSDGDKISLTLPKNAKGSLVVQFYNDENKVVLTFSKKLVNGKAIISVVNSKSYGRYSKVVGKYTGKDYKVETVVEDDVIINPPIKMPNKLVKGEKKYVSLSLPSGKEGILKIVVREKDENKGTYSNALKISKKLVNGTARISLSKFKVGDVHRVCFIETVNGKKVADYDYNVHVPIINPLNILSSKLHYGKANVKIKAYKAVGKPLANKIITVKVNNKVVKKVKTNKKGVAVFKMPKKYKPNTYKITAQYNNDAISKKIKIIR